MSGILGVPIYESFISVNDIIDPTYCITLKKSEKLSEFMKFDPSHARKQRLDEAAALRKRANSVFLHPLPETRRAPHECIQCEIPLYAEKQTETEFPQLEIPFVSPEHARLMLWKKFESLHVDYSFVTGFFSHYALDIMKKSSFGIDDKEKYKNEVNKMDAVQNSLKTLMGVIEQHSKSGYLDGWWRNSGLDFSVLDEALSKLREALDVSFAEEKHFKVVDLNGSQYKLYDTDKFHIHGYDLVKTTCVASDLNVNSYSDPLATSHKNKSDILLDSKDLSQSHCTRDSLGVSEHVKISSPLGNVTVSCSKYLESSLVKKKYIKSDSLPSAPITTGKKTTDLSSNDFVAKEVFKNDLVEEKNKVNLVQDEFTDGYLIHDVDSSKHDFQQEEYIESSEDRDASKDRNARNSLENGICDSIPATSCDKSLDDNADTAAAQDFEVKVIKDPSVLESFSTKKKHTKRTSEIGTLNFSTTTGRGASKGPSPAVTKQSQKGQKNPTIPVKETKASRSRMAKVGVGIATANASKTTNTSTQPKSKQELKQKK